MSHVVKLVFISKAEEMMKTIEKEGIPVRAHEGKNGVWLFFEQKEAKIVGKSSTV